MVKKNSKATELGSVIDLFSGIGGLSHGFYLEGFNVVAGIDVDVSCRYAFEINNKATFLHRNIDDITGEELNRLFDKNKPKILIGCAPCQPFSTYTQKRKNNEKWKLLKEFSRVIKEIDPDIVSMENVPRLLKFKAGEVFNEFVESLAECGFKVFSKLVFCPDYGIPQSRTRLVLIASKNGVIELAPPTHSQTSYECIEDAIKHLPAISAGEQCRFDPLHRASGLSPTNLKRIKSSNPGGSWKDWDDRLVADCHKRKTGNGYASVYGRMSWNKPAPTITTECYGFGSGRFGHPDQDRAISLREAALLQTIPKSYKFIEPDSKYSISILGRHIGNVVPVRLARVIANSIAMGLKDHYG
jgi:DNA (cytosine-5)-methyltransferase 1